MENDLANVEGSEPLKITPENADGLYFRTKSLLYSELVGREVDETRKAEFRREASSFVALFTHFVDKTGLNPTENLLRRIGSLSPDETNESYFNALKTIDNEIKDFYKQQRESK